jgi:hypothetical protein
MPHIDLARHHVGNQPRAVFLDKGDLALGALDC